MARIKKKNFISSLCLLLITLIFMSGCTAGDEDLAASASGAMESSGWITSTDETTFSILSPSDWQTAVGRGALLEGFITQDYLDQLWDTKSTLLFVAFDSESESNVQVMADLSGLLYWSNQLNIGAETRYEVLLGFSESIENKLLFTEMTGFG